MNKELDDQLVRSASIATPNPASMCHHLLWLARTAHCMLTVTKLNSLAYSCHGWMRWILGLNAIPLVGDVRGRSRRAQCFRAFMTDTPFDDPRAMDWPHKQAIASAIQAH